MFTIKKKNQWLNDKLSPITVSQNNHSKSAFNLTCVYKSEVKVKTSKRKKVSNMTVVNPAEKLRNSEFATSMKLVSQLSVVDDNMLQRFVNWATLVHAICCSLFTILSEVAYVMMVLIYSSNIHGTSIGTIIAQAWQSVENRVNSVNSKSKDKQTHKCAHATQWAHAFQLWNK